MRLAAVGSAGQAHGVFQQLVRIEMRQAQDRVLVRCFRGCNRPQPAVERQTLDRVSRIHQRAMDSTRLHDTPPSHPVFRAETLRAS